MSVHYRGSLGCVLTRDAVVDVALGSIVASVAACVFVVHTVAAAVSRNVIAAVAVAAVVAVIRKRFCEARDYGGDGRLCVTHHATSTRHTPRDDHRVTHHVTTPRQATHNNDNQRDIDGTAASPHHAWACPAAAWPAARPSRRDP